MRMSCNGCRVLRKGCSEDCPIRPCLRWIKSSQSQANATVFLAKFYGRAGLINLLSAVPDHHLRPSIFKSLLYEACGRIVNPVHGSTGLLWSGSWHLCQDAVESVLSGSPIKRISGDDDGDHHSAAAGPPLQACDIRHVSKPDRASSKSSAGRLHKVRSGGRFKRSGNAKPTRTESVSGESHLSPCRVRWSESDSGSVETVEASMLPQQAEDGGDELELELTLGFDRTAKRASLERRESSDDTCQLRVGFDAWE